MTPINRKPKLWFYRGAWRCHALHRDEIGVGSTPYQAYLFWAVGVGLFNWQRK